ncbi:29722_t:CDS:2, partial [Racocetra persica]
TRPATEGELKKYAFLKSLLNLKPERTKPPVNAELRVQYKVVKSDNATYTYTITNRVTPDRENENQKYVISGIVKDLTNRTETDHESRMMGHLHEIGYFHDSRRPTNDEMHIVKYNNDLYIDSSKSGIISLFKNTIKYLFLNNMETTKERVRKLFQYAETVITIIDENPKATIQKLVKSPSIEDYPQVANIVNKSPDELNIMLSLSTLSDQVSMVNQNLVKDFGNNMVKGSIIEQLELKL